MADLLPAMDEERQVLKFLDAIDAETEGAKKNVTKFWEDNLRLVRGDQWRLKRAPYFLANIIKNNVRRKVGTLTETGPHIRVQPLKKGLDKSARVLYNVSKSILDRDRSKDSIERASRFGMTVGCGFFHIPYDPLDNNVHVWFIDPRRVYLDPSVVASGDLDEGQYIRLDTVAPLHEIRKRFAGKGLLVKQDDRYGAFPNATNNPSLLGTVLSQMPRVFRPMAATKVGPIPRALLKEYWVKDPQVNALGDPLFPGGRHIVRASNIILVDEPNPYWDGGWPLVMFDWDMDFESPWGLDEIQDLRRIQEAINRMGDAWVRNVLTGSNFRVVADMDALDNDQWDKLDNEAGLVIRKKPQRQFDYVPPVDLGTTIPNTISSFIQLMDLITGNMDTQGGKGEATESSMLDGLQMARQTLIRAVARRLESALDRVGQKLISRIFQYFTSDKVLFQLGPDRDWISYSYERMKILEDDNGKARPAEDIQKYFKDYQFMVTPGSSLAVSRIQRTMTLVQMRSATGFVPSVKRILAEADIGDPDALIKEGLDELGSLPQPPPPKGRGGTK